MIYTTTTTDSEQTVALGRELGRRLRGGELLELTADIGGGKTTLTKGVLAGLGYYGPVPSPTFTISRLYELAGGRRLYHYDFYRLSEPDMATNELAEALEDTHTICVVEWGEQVPEVLPKSRIMVTISVGNNENDRIIQITVPKSQAYVIEGLSL